MSQKVAFCGTETGDSFRSFRVPGAVPSTARVERGQPTVAARDAPEAACTILASVGTGVNGLLRVRKTDGSETVSGPPIAAEGSRRDW